MHVTREKGLLCGQETGNSRPGGGKPTGTCASGAATACVVAAAFVASPAPAHQRTNLSSQGKSNTINMPILQRGTTMLGMESKVERSGEGWRGMAHQLRLRQSPLS